MAALQQLKLCVNEVANEYRCAVALEIEPGDGYVINDPRSAASLFDQLPEELEDFVFVEETNLMVFSFYLWHA